MRLVSMEGWREGSKSGKTRSKVQERRMRRGECARVRCPYSSKGLTLCPQKYTEIHKTHKTHAADVNVIKKTQIQNKADKKKDYLSLS